LPVFFFFLTSSSLDKQQADGLWALLLGLCIEASQLPPPPLGNEANFETLELVTASMWTLLRKSAQSGSPLVCVPKD